VHKRGSERDEAAARVAARTQHLRRRCWRFWRLAMRRRRCCEPAPRSGSRRGSPAASSTGPAPSLSRPRLPHHQHRHHRNCLREQHTASATPTRSGPAAVEDSSSLLLQHVDHASMQGVQHAELVGAPLTPERCGMHTLRGRSGNEYAYTQDSPTAWTQVDVTSYVRMHALTRTRPLARIPERRSQRLVMRRFARAPEHGGRQRRRPMVAQVVH